MKHLTIIFLLIISCVHKNFSVAIPLVTKGELNLQGFNTGSKGMVKLNGEWEFYEGKLIKTYPGKSLPECIYVRVPDSWNNYAGSGKIKNGQGYGSFRMLLQKDKNENFALMLKDISSCYKLWINNELMDQVGIVDTIASLSVPVYEKVTRALNGDTGIYEIVIEVANFNQHKGGIKTHINLIKTSQVKLQHERESLRTYFCLGIIFIIGLYHIGLFLLNKNDLPGLNFGLFCFDIFIFLSFRARLVNYFIKDFDWELGNKIEYISLYLSLPLFYIFFYRSFPQQFKRFFKITAITISLVFIGITLLTKTLEFSHTLEIFHYVLILYILVVSSGLVKALVKKASGSRIIFAGFLIFAIALINDILHVQNRINTDNFIIYGVVSFIVCQAFFLAFKSAVDNRKIVNLSVSLNDLNKSLSRFVPTDFMRLLDKKSITEVSLGNNAEREMTIMFSDIRAFTAISEKLSPSESFAFINEYLKKIAPIIRKHGGFIDKYMGDGIMALFPNHADDAILAAKSMMLALDEFNADNEKTNKPTISIGIGMHTGMCILGTVGEPMRMDTTVIADAVNLASRIESLTKFYKTPIIISEETFNQTGSEQLSHIRYIGTAQVKGKSINTKLYKVFFDHQYNTGLLDEFDKAITLFYNQKFAEASGIFEKLMATNLSDGVLELYLSQSKTYAQNGPPPGWKTFEVFEY